jgi:hypothetical protein
MPGCYDARCEIAGGPGCQNGNRELAEKLGLWFGDNDERNWGNVNCCFKGLVHMCVDALKPPCECDANEPAACVTVSPPLTLSNRTTTNTPQHTSKQNVNRIEGNLAHDHDRV